VQAKPVLFTFDILDAICLETITVSLVRSKQTFVENGFFTRNSFIWSPMYNADFITKLLL